MSKFKLLLILFLFSLTNIFGQLTKEVTHPDIAGRLFRNPAREAAKIQGSPYLKPFFKEVSVTKIKTIAQMRYNVFNDEFEFISPKKDTLILDKIEDFGALNFVNTSINYKLCNYTNQNEKIVYGYLIDLHQNGEFGLFKKENISLTEEKIAKTSLEQNMPAKYYNSGSSYFLKNGKNIIAFPNSKKRLLKIFPEKQVAIETFVKDNKIDFDIEADKIKLIDFMAAK